MLKFGKVTKIDAKKALVKVKFFGMDDIESNWLRILQQKTVEDQFYSMPDIDEQVVCLMEDSLNRGVVLGSIYSETVPPPVTDENIYYKKFQDGTEISYDRKSSSMIIKGEGSLDVEFKTDSKISIKGNSNISVDGESDITVGGDCKVSVTGAAKVTSSDAITINAMSDCKVSSTSKVTLFAPQVAIGSAPIAGIVHGMTPCPLMGTHMAGASTTCKVTI